LAMNEMQTPWSMDQTKEKVIRNRFDILKRFLQQNKYHHTTLKLCSKQRSKQHLSTKRWLHICFDLRARYLFPVKDFTSIILDVGRAPKLANLILLKVGNGISARRKNRPDSNCLQIWEFFVKVDY
jgi:hypothetical protein